MRTLGIAFCVLMLAASLPAQGQSEQSPQGDLAVTFTPQHSSNALSGGNFWTLGGSSEVGFKLRNNLGFAADYTGSHTILDGSEGFPLTLSVITGGPRLRLNRDRRWSEYGETLFGYARGSNSRFPTSRGFVSSAGSFALQLNGGIDLRLSRRVALRALDIGYLRTTLPNGTDNEQNLLRLGSGIVFRFGSSDR